MKLSYIAKIFIPLLLICAFTAGIVSGVELLTRDPIAENEKIMETERENAKLEILASVYGEKTFSIVENIPEEVDEVRISDGGEVCVTLTCSGYKKDSICLFVMFDNKLTVLRVSVLSSNETKGIGTKVSDEAYLEQYTGNAYTVTIGKNGIDKIAGATVSSKAVANGINTARRAAIKVLEDKE